jgi:signal transduction histidine kinase
VTLTARLLAFFLAALAVVLAGFSATLYGLARSHLEARADERGCAALDAITAAAEDEPSGLEWNSAQRALPLRPGGNEVAWGVFDGPRRIDGSRHLADWWAGLAIGPDAPERSELTQADGPWRAFVRTLRTARSEPIDAPDRYARLTFAAAVPIAPVRDALRSLAVALAALSVGTWLAAAAGGRWLCRRALAPLSRMAEAARGMTAADLTLRLPQSAARDEVADLGAAFNDLLGRVRDAYERQKRFTGEASHQLRTPLAAMLGQVEVILRRGRPADEYRVTLESVARQGNHLRQIVESLLFLARADADAGLPAVEVVDLREWLAERLRSWDGHPRRPDLTLDPGGRAAWARAHPVLLGQALDNLIDNAFKYSEPGTPVVVELAADGATVRLGVADRGVGVSPRDLPHVFEPFYRAAASWTRGVGGAGLGLAVAQRVAASHGGRVEAASVPGAGSRFTVVLPALTASEVEAAAYQSPGDEHSGLRVPRPRVQSL